MGRRSRFVAEEKIEAIEAYIRGTVGWKQLTDNFGIANSTLQSWIRKYRESGAEGLREKPNNRHYTSELKKTAVEAYLAEEGSQEEICRRYHISSRILLQNWIKEYNGHKELRPSKGRGSDIYMTKGRNTTYEERVEIVSYCIENGNDYTATIEKYGVSYQQIYSWVRKYNEKGAEGLVDKRGKRKPESEMTELEKLRAENRMLAARNKRLETENAVLKKLEEIERRWR